MAGMKSEVRPGNLSAEFVQDSSDSESDTQPSKLPTKLSEKSNNVLTSQQNKNVSSSAASAANKESSSESAKSPSVREASSDSSDQDDTSSVSSRSSRKRNGESANLSTNRLIKKPKTRGAPVRIAAKSFETPTGYELLSNDPSDYSAASLQMFDDLTNKQIWHIVAPASLSIENIEKLDVQAAIQGKPIFEKDGVNYNMAAGSAQDMVLLLPHGNDIAYSQGKSGIARTFQLREMAKMGKQDEESTADVQKFSASKPGVKVKPRSQPEGLRMRYVPFGADISISKPQANGDVQMQDNFEIPEEISEIQTPKPPKKKSKHKKDEASMSEETPGSGGLSTEKDRTETPQLSKQESPDKEMSKDGKDKKRRKKRSKLIDQPVL